MSTGHEKAGPLDTAADGTQIREAIDRLTELVVDGLKHGFFHFEVGCEIANRGKRHLTIKAGKSHKFTIPENELPR